jgi:mRNA interferase MazF
MIICNKWEIVTVPFPFTDLSSSKKRPALIVSPNNFNIGKDVVIAFVTSQIPFPLRFGDYELQKWIEAGLPKRSVVRMKFATLDKNLVIKKIGEIEPVDRKEIEEMIILFFKS